MKIAIYVPSWPPGSSANGIVTYAAEIVPALRNFGHEVYVLTSDVRSDKHDEYTIDLARLQSTHSVKSRIERALYRQTPYNIATPAIVRAVRKLIRTKGIDIFEIEDSFGWSYAVSQLRIVPVVVRLHGPWFLNGRYDRRETNRHTDPEREVLERRGIENADLITSPSKSVLQSVRRHYGLPLQNSLVIPNSISAVRESDIWQPDKCAPSTLLYVGRFDERKGGDLVIKAFATLAKNDPKLRLIFVGPDLGVTSPDGKVEKFHEFARRNTSDEIRRRIDFRGTLSQPEIASLRRTSFATVIASQYEILPYAVLEAMACGCPLVATSVGGIPEVIKNMENGLLVPAQDVGALASACRLLLNGPDLAARLGKQAWEDSRTRYTPEKLASDTLAAYERARSAWN